MKMRWMWRWLPQVGVCIVRMMMLEVGRWWGKWRCTGHHSLGGAHHLKHL